VPEQQLVGSSARRVEDPRLLTGRGRYVDDLPRDGVLHAAFVRSHLAHGRIRAVDVSAARQAPGVVLVLTAGDLESVVGFLEAGGPPELATPRYRALAGDKVRVGGEPIVAVIAESRALAEDACELVDVHIEPLDTVITFDDALDDSLPPLFDELGTNVVYERHDAYGDPDGAFARADRVVSARFEQQRMANVPLEGRAILADYDPATDQLAIDVAHQNPHGLRIAVIALFGHDPDHVVVRCGDIGGSFGQKAYTTREELCVIAATRMLGRPVKWIEDRVENLLAAGHARDDRLDVEMAVLDDGTILGARVHMFVNQGAYQITVLPPTIFVNLVRVLFPNAYRIPDYEFRGTIVTSNTGTYLAFRGPWESESWTRERMIDMVARELGMEPADVRRRNLLTVAEQPVHMATGPTVAHMTAYDTFERACALADVPDFRRRQLAAREEGRYLGFGMATFAEAAPGGPDFGPALGQGSSPRAAQEARARLEPDGRVTVFTSQQPHGQGHETTLAQLAADGLGLPLDRATVVHGDTAATPFNMVGTGGSRAATLASGAVVGAVAALRELIVQEYADRHELDPQDVELRDGRVYARGVPSTAWELADVAADSTRELEATADFAIPEGGWTQATHCCWVEVDVATGEVTIPRFLVVEDCGEMINPMIVEGQISGGVVQGIATVLLDRIVYDEVGQLRTTTLMDYLLPTTTEVPTIEIVHLQSPPQGPIDFRGVGESGAIGAPAALSNAIEDALAPFGARITHKHLPPDRILDLIAAGGQVDQVRTR
jgi:carbon-monoxide dehydrogenase large subunit